MNLSGSLLIWTLGQMPAEFYTKLDNTFIGNVIWEGNDGWGNYLYVRSLSDYSASLISMIRKHTMYVQDYYDEDGRQVLIFKFTGEQKQTIVAPFIRGEYSKIDRDYVKKYFKKTTNSGKISTNWQILHKAKELREHWMRELNVTPYIRITIPEDAEVWSKIKKKLEILNFEIDQVHQERSFEAR